MPTLAHGPRLHCAPIFALAFRIRRMTMRSADRSPTEGSHNRNQPMR
jgi:hypothetical protein